MFCSPSVFTKYNNFFLHHLNELWLQDIGFAFFFLWIIINVWAAQWYHLTLFPPRSNYTAAITEWYIKMMQNTSKTTLPLSNEQADRLCKSGWIISPLFIVHSHDVLFPQCCAQDVQSSFLCLGLNQHLEVSRVSVSTRRSVPCRLSLNVTASLTTPPLSNANQPPTQLPQAIHHSSILKPKTPKFEGYFFFFDNCHAKGINDMSLVLYLVSFKLTVPHPTECRGGSRDWGFHSNQH